MSVLVLLVACGFVAPEPERPVDVGPAESEPQIGSRPDPSHPESAASMRDAREPPDQPDLLPDAPPLPPPDPGIVRLFDGASRFMPSDLVDTREAVRAWDGDPVPTLLSLAKPGDERNHLFAVCMVLGALDVRDARVAPHLAPILSTNDVLAVSTCGQAIAHTLPEDSPHLELVWSIVRDEGARCTTRENIARKLREPSVCEALFEMSLHRGCRQTTGIAGLGSCEGSQAHLVSIAADPAQGLQARVDSLAALRRLAPHPPGRSTYLWWAERGKSVQGEGVANNGAAFALELLAGVGEPADVSLLRRIEREAEYGPEDVHAIEARAAIAAIEDRQRSAPGD